MPNNTHSLSNKVALVTGSAKRIGACFIENLHTAGASVVIHYKDSHTQAKALELKLNTIRQNSAIALQADLLQVRNCQSLIEHAIAHWGRLDILVNNASSFYPTPIEKCDESHWDELLGSNLKAPFFLSQAAAKELEKRSGSIVNMVDIHAQRPLRHHSVYCAAKAGLIMLTHSLAKDLAPRVRVNAIAPGSILWPQGQASLKASDKEKILSEIELQRQGTPQDLANTLLFLVSSSSGYITGQLLSVDGGRSL
jgi:pteridine reductase